MPIASSSQGRERTYDARGRQEHAHRQHQATLERARDLFLANGYTATTVESIAAAAGVSAATIYKTYGGKAGLVRDLCVQALGGSDPVLPAEERSDALRGVASTRDLVEGWGRLVEEISPLVSPLLLLLRAAAETDPDAADLHAEFDRARLDRMADNAHHLADRGALSEATDATTARDVLWLCTSPELYELLVQQRGWTPAQLGTFAARTIAATLL